MQRSEEPQVQGIHIGFVLQVTVIHSNPYDSARAWSHPRAPYLQQELGDLKVSVGAGVVEWDQPSLVLGMHVRPMLEQQLDHAHPVVAGSEVEGSGLKWKHWCL